MMRGLGIAALLVLALVATSIASPAAGPFGFQGEDDPDYDGIPTAQELRDGTDPNDPSDARAWHPELDQHPRLLADLDQWLAVFDAIEAGDPDAVRLFSRLQSWANREPIIQDPAEHHFGYDETNSSTALGAAFCAAALDDADYAAKAIEIGAAYTFDLSMWTLAEWDYGTILGGMALANLALTYDLLKGFGFLSRTDDARLRAAILNYTDVLVDMYIRLPIGKFLANNHIIKFTSGVGLVGMTFNDTRAAAHYVNLALSTAPWVLFDFQMPEGGGQGEGPNYLDYTFKTFLPFAAAYHRYASGAALPYKTICRTRLQFPCHEQVEMVPDPLADPRFQELLDWRMAITMPGGKAPPIDDACPSCGYPGTLAALSSRADYAWLYRESRDCTYAGSDLALVELANLDGFVPPAPPVYEAISMPEAGQAILRNGWGPDAMYALLNGEHGVARLAGIGHEQADATNFIFNALGEYFVIDSGYPGYDERQHVCFAENHNLILVDGLGPPIGLFYVLADSDAYLTDFVNEPDFQAARVHSAYRGAQVDRYVMLAGDEMFITWDRIIAPEAHTYTWRMHTLAGGTTNGLFTLTDNGALIQRPSAAMESRVLTLDDQTTWREAEAEHAYSHSGIDRHAVLEVEASGTAATFLGVHVPATELAELPTIQDVRGDDYALWLVTFPTIVDYVIITLGQPTTAIDLLGGAGVLLTDASFVWLRLDAETGAVLAVHQFGGSYAEVIPC